MTINKGSTTPDIDMFEDFLKEKKMFLHTISMYN